MTTKIKTPGITDANVTTAKILDANVTTAKLNLISTSGTPGATIKGTSGQTDGYLQLNCEENTHGIKLKSPPHSAAQSYTLTFPQSITNGYFLKTDGSGNLSFAEVNVDDTAWQSSIVTAATLNAVVGYGYWIDTTSNACTITLPGSANVGDQIIFVDYARTWATNAVTLSLNGLKYQGGINNPIYDTNGQTVNIVYSGATKGWIPISDDDVVDEGVPPPYSVDFLAIAGGGGGAKGVGAGGGAGGYRNSFSTESSGGGGSSETALSLTIGTTYTVTVGAGGDGGDSNAGTSGANSVISGSDITSITSIGGGKGGSLNLSIAGADGGSGGGGGGGGTGNNGSGTANQGFNGGQGNNGGGQACAGGGGGASAVGAAGSTSAGGNGGAGLSSSITGSAVTRTGGGGGSGRNSGTGGTGGAGGGGNGGVLTTLGTAGTVNTGSGGGGSHDVDGAGGGSGVVILSMPDANYSGTTTGSPTVATGVAGKTVLTFNGSGSYTG